MVKAQVQCLILVLLRGYLTHQDIDWIKGSSPRLKTNTTLLELKPKPKVWGSPDFEWVKAQAQGLRFIWLCLNWNPSLRLEVHLIFLEWVEVQTQGLKFTWPLFLNQSPSSNLKALMTLLESRPKSNVWHPNDFNKFKTQVQRLEPIQTFCKMKMPKPDVWGSHDPVGLKPRV